MANPNAAEDGKKGGRPRGSRNKLPRDLKEKVLTICGQLEDEGKSLHDCASEDPQWFYANFIKPMLPKDVKIDAKVDLTSDQLDARLSQLLGKVGITGASGGEGAQE